MNDKIKFDIETGIMTINDIYEIKPRMTVDDVLKSNLIDLLSEKVGHEYIHKKDNPRVIFRKFNVDNIPVRVNFDFEFWGKHELSGIDVVVKAIGEEFRRELDTEEFREICRIHDDFLYNMCTSKAGVNGSRVSFYGGYIDRIYDNRTPNIKIKIEFWTKEMVEDEERFDNLSEEEQMREIYEERQRMLAAAKKRLENRIKRWGE